MERLRIRAMNLSGSPVAGIVVELILATSIRGFAPPGNETETPATVALRSLTTSRDGFAIFSLATLASRSPDQELALRFAGRQDLTFALDSRWLVQGGAYVAFTLPLPSGADSTSSRSGHAGTQWIDDGLDPTDVWLVPNAIPDFEDLDFGEDYCGRLVPSDQTRRTFYHNQIIRTSKNATSCLSRTSEGRQDVVLHEGELIQYEIRWSRLGYSFGDLLYSLPLAPCESVTLAISHWEQRQSAKAEQSSETQERKSAAYLRQNALSESVNALAKQTHLNFAVTNATAAGTGTSASGLIYGILAKATSALQTSFGVSGAGAYDRKTLAADSARRFSDSIQQSAEAWRQDHQVVILEQAETEDQTVSHRRVCNNNHCHVLNIFYHEVLNNFRVTTKILGHREVYLVPYELEDFDASRAICAKTFLIPLLLDPALSECFDQAATEAAISSASAEASLFKIDLKVAVRVNANQDRFFLVVILRTGARLNFPFTLGDNVVVGQVNSFFVGVPRVDIGDIQQIGLRREVSGLGFLAPFLVVDFISIFVETSRGEWMNIAASQAPNSLFDRADVLFAVNSRMPEEVGGSCLARLLAHLNCNKHYYNSILWLLEDSNQRFQRFEQISCGASGITLNDLIVPEPVAVLGNYVAFPKAGSSFVKATAGESGEERLVTLPTAGIFADAVLGRCTTCETIDPRTNWNWKDAPCTCAGETTSLKAPEANSLLAGAAGLFPAIATQSLVSFPTPPASEAAATNSLVSQFGSALATALLSSSDSGKALGELEKLLEKMTEALKDLIPEPGEPPKT